MSILSDRITREKVGKLKNYFDDNNRNVSFNSVGCSKGSNDR